MLSLLLALITHQLVTGRARAYAVAQAMTRELRASEERYRRIVDTAAEGIWLLDAERRIVFVNPRIAQVAGHASEDDRCKARPVDRLHGSRRRPRAAARRVADPASSEADGKGKHPIELRLRRRDGSTMWVSLSRRPILDDAGHADRTRWAC